MSGLTPWSNISVQPPIRNAYASKGSKPAAIRCFKHEKRCVYVYIHIGFLMMFESGYRGGGVVNICDRYFGSFGTGGFRLRNVEGGIFSTSYSPIIMD
jgi:hypothetical protein